MRFLKHKTFIFKIINEKRFVLKNFIPEMSDAASLWSKKKRICLFVCPRVCIALTRAKIFRLT